MQFVNDRTPIFFQLSDSVDKTLLIIRPAACPRFVASTRCIHIVPTDIPSDDTRRRNQNSYGPRRAQRIQQIRALPSRNTEVVKQDCISSVIRDGVSVKEGVASQGQRQRSKSERISQRSVVPNLCSVYRQRRLHFRYSKKDSDSSQTHNNAS